MAGEPWEIDDTAPGYGYPPWMIDDIPKGVPMTRPNQADFATSPVDQFGLGVAQGALSLGSGVRSLLPNAVGSALSLPKQEDVNRLRDYNRDSGWATAGNIAGDVALTALPFAKAAGLAGKLGKYTPAAADMAMSAGYGALTADEGMGGYGAGMGALGSGLGSAASQGAARLLAPSGRIAPEAQALIDAGIPLTPGQAKPEGLLGFLEPYLAKVPGVGGLVRDRQAEASQATLGALARKMGVDPALLTNAKPHEVTKLLTGKVDEAYSAAGQNATTLKKQFKFDPMRAAGQMQNIQGMPFGADKDALREMMLGMRLIKKAKTPAEAFAAWKKTDSLLGATPELASIQEMWRNSFHAAVPTSASKKALEADLLSRQVRALDKGVGVKSNVIPEQLVRGLRNVDIDPRTVETNAARWIPQDEATALGNQAMELNKLGESAADLAQRQQAPWVIPQAAAALGLGHMWGGMAASLPMAAAGAGGTALAYTKPGVKWATSQIPELLRASQSFEDGWAKQLSRRLGAGVIGDE